MGFTAHNVQLNFVNVPFVWSGEEKLEQFLNPTRVRERLATVPSWEHLHVCLSLQCADRGQTGAVQCCSAAVLQGHASDSPLYRYTAKPVPADAKNTREEKSFAVNFVIW